MHPQLKMTWYMAGFILNLSSIESSKRLVVTFAATSCQWNEIRVLLIIASMILWSTQQEPVCAVPFLDENIIWTTEPNWPAIAKGHMFIFNQTQNSLTMKSFAFQSVLGKIKKRLLFSAALSGCSYSDNSVALSIYTRKKFDPLATL